MKRKLEIIYFFFNFLTGRLPPEIGNLHQLVDFGVYNNRIEGPIDFNIFMNMSSLQDLQLWRNHFIGNLPRDIGNLTMLTFLGLTENNLTGTSEFNVNGYNISLPLTFSSDSFNLIFCRGYS